MDDLFPTAEALHILEFGELKDGTLKLTAAGRVFAGSGMEERKRLFERAPASVRASRRPHRRVLDERKGHRAPRLRFETELEDHLSRRDAERTLRAVTGWGRYSNT